MQDIETLWADFARPIVTADDYIASLRGRRMNVFFMGERVPEPVEHPVIFPSINALADAPLSRSSFNVGSAALMRASSVIRLPSRGTLKSTRTSTRLPSTSRSSSVRMHQHALREPAARQIPAGSKGMVHRRRALDRTRLLPALRR